MLRFFLKHRLSTQYPQGGDLAQHDNTQCCIGLSVYGLTSSLYYHQGCRQGVDEVKMILRGLPGSPENNLIAY